MGLAIIEYNPQHFFLIQREEEEQKCLERLFGAHNIASRLSQGWAATVINEKGRVLACLGIVDLWEGVGEAWMSADREWLLSHRKTFLRLSRMLMVRTILRNNLERIQADIDQGALTSWIWAKHHGLCFEGLQRKYMAGRNFGRWAWTREG